MITKSEPPIDLIPVDINSLSEKISSRSEIGDVAAVQKYFGKIEQDIENNAIKFQAVVHKFDLAHKLAALALRVAAQNGHLKLLKWLLGKYPGFLNGIALACDDALFLALEENHNNIVFYLLGNSWCSIDAQNDDGESLLLIAIRLINVEVVDWILKNLKRLCRLASQKNELEIVLGEVGPNFTSPLDVALDSLGESFDDDALMNIIEKLFKKYSLWLNNKVDYFSWVLPPVFRALQAGSITIKQSLPLIINNKINAHLFLPDIPSEACYVIGNPALNSSGDSYHTVTYELVAKILGYKQLQMLFLYDTEEVKKQVNRAAGFFSRLGLKDIITTTELKRACTQPNVRMNLLRQCASESTQPLYLVDQKVTTILISKLFEQYGFDNATQLIRMSYQLFIHFTKKKYPNEFEVIETWVEAEFSKIRTKCSGKNILFFNHRISQGANKKQEIGDVAIELIEEEINRQYPSNSIVLWSLVSDSNVHNRGTENTNKTFLFNTDLAGKAHIIDQTADENGLYKVRHVMLLMRLLELKNIIGMIGNTSGTLDIAAFLGFRVYCFHHFSDGDYYKAQDYRMLQQHRFLSIGQPISQKLSPEIPNFRRWLQCEGKNVDIYSLLPNKVRFNPGNQRYETHNERLPFSGALTWGVPNDPRDLSSYSQLQVGTQPKIMFFPFFEKEDKAICAKLDRLAADGQKSRLRQPSGRI